MKNARTPKAALIRLLCVLAVMLMLAGCAEGKPGAQPTEKGTAVETAAEVQSVDTAEAAPELQTEEVLTEATDETEAAEETTEATTEETTEVTTEATETTEATDETVAATEETLPPEEDPEAELAAAQEENLRLKEEVESLNGQLEQQNKMKTILYAAGGAILLLALIFLYFWRSAVAALKRARRKLIQRDPDTPISQIYVGKTHGIGGRSSQQDSFSVSPAEMYGQNGVLAVVADGMGGLEDGDKASQTAVITAMESFFQITGPGTERLMQILSVTKNAVNSVKAELGTSECGTTLVMGLIQNGEFHYVSVGDSRIYLYRAGRLIQLNREHSYLFDQLRMAANGRISMQEALGNEKNSCITSYMGMKDIAHIDIPATPISVLPKDKFLLMSDGVYNALSQEEICLAMRHPAQEAADVIGNFIATKRFQNQDNYTMVVLECQ